MATIGSEVGMMAEINARRQNIAARGIAGIGSELAPTSQERSDINRFDLETKAQSMPLNTGEQIEAASYLQDLAKWGKLADNADPKVLASIPRSMTTGGMAALRNAHKAAQDQSLHKEGLRAQFGRQEAAKPVFNLEQTAQAMYGDAIGSLKQVAGTKGEIPPEAMKGLQTAMLMRALNDAAPHINNPRGKLIVPQEYVEPAKFVQEFQSIAATQGDGPATDYARQVAEGNYNGKPPSQRTQNLAARIASEAQMDIQRPGSWQKFKAWWTKQPEPRATAKATLPTTYGFNKPTPAHVPGQPYDLKTSYVPPTEQPQGATAPAPAPAPAPTGQKPTLESLMADPKFQAMSPAGRAATLKKLGLAQ